MFGLIVDSFAGGGGASLGISMALGRGPDVAINHDASAIAMHTANHPETKHFTEDVWKVKPRTVTRGRPVQLLWSSPDCTHFSRAKGGKPVKKEIRSLAWVIVKWAVEVKPALIILENVREFEDWGPLLPAWRCQACSWRGTEGQTSLARWRRRCPRCDSLRLAATPDLIPDPARRGLTFRRWIGRLRNLGYEVQWRNLNAADFGAPTHRRRLFLIARCDGLPIVWPVPTHADPRKLDAEPLFGRPAPWRTAAEIIDWTLPCPSIFDRKKPLADKTLRRIAMGLQRYVLENPNPFIVPVTHVGERRVHPADEPLPTITGANRGELAVASPYLARIGQTGGNGKYSNGVTEPVTTVTSKREHVLVTPILVGVGGADYAGKPRPADQPKGVVLPNDRTCVVAPTLIQTGYSERQGQSPRAPGLDKPLGTAVAGGQKHALVAATLAKFYGGVVGHGPDRPIGTVTGIDHHGLVAAHLVKFRGESKGSGVDEPAPTITSGAGAARPAGAAHALGMAAVCLARFNHGDKQWNGIDDPLGTVTSQGNKFGLVYAFLTKYFGTATGQALDVPLHTATGKHRFGLVMVEIEPGKVEPAVGLDVPGVGPCVVADIGLRMLTPRELARAQGFPDSYVLTGSKSSQVAKIGNSVCPAMAKVLVETNYQPADVLVCA